MRLITGETPALLLQTARAFSCIIFVWSSDDVLLLRCFVFVCVCGVTAVAAPKIRVEPEALDFGAMQAGTQAEKTVVIFNDGDSPLIVLRGKTTCGCTTIDVPEGEFGSIPPGKSKNATVRFDTTDRTGTQSAVVAITTNDPERPAVTINVTANIETLTILRPPKGLAWQQAPRGEEIRRTVVIVPGEATHEIELIEIASDQASLTPKAVKVTRNGQQMIDVKFVLAKDAPLGEMFATVTASVRVESEETTVKIPANGIVVGDVIVTPLEIAATQSRMARGAKIGEVLVRSSRGGRAPDIVGVQAVGPVRAELDQMQGEDLRKISVFVADNAVAGACSATVYVMTTAGDSPVANVPVYFSVGSAIQAVPDVIMLNATRATQRIELRCETSAFTIKKASSGSERIKATIVTAKCEDNSKPAVIEVSIAESIETAARGALLSIETDLPGDELVSVPVIVQR